jgi:hypothetical protein
VNVVRCVSHASEFCIYFHCMFFLYILIVFPSSPLVNSRIIYTYIYIYIAQSMRILIENCITMVEYYLKGTHETKLFSLKRSAVFERTTSYTNIVFARTMFIKLSTNWPLQVCSKRPQTFVPQLLKPGATPGTGVLSIIINQNLLKGSK